MDAKRPRPSDWVQRFFDRNVDDYLSKHYDGVLRTFMTVRQDRVLAFVRRLPLGSGARVLDAGCGPGVLLGELRRLGLQVYGLDAAEHMVRKARERLKEESWSGSVGLLQGSIEALPYRDSSFDLYCSTGVIEYLDGDDRMLSEACRVLRPGAALILSITNLWSPINYLDTLIEKVKRVDVIRRAFNRVWIRLGHGAVIARHFRVRRHSRSQIIRSLTEAGFNVVDGEYFHFLPWPRPVDQVFPRLSALLGARMETLARSRLGWLAEGYVIVCVKV